VVQVTDAGVAPELGGAPFLVMELLEGADLERVSGDRASPAETVVEWLRQVARALTRAHEAGIVHRDLKPENLFLTRREDGSPLVKVLDFGVAKVAAENSALTTSGSILGTPRYMAPEQTDSRGAPVTLRADLYALGLIAFKLLTGRMYWRDGSLAQLLAQILADPMPPASERGAGFGPQFDAWFERACCRDPERRFASATTQVEALATALGIAGEVDVIGGSPWREAGTTGGSSGVRTRARIMAGAALATLAIVAVAWWALARPPPLAGDPAPRQRPVPAAPPSTSGVSPAPEAIGVDAGPGAVPVTSPSAGRPAKRPAAPAAASAPSSLGAHGPADPLEGPW
jgi:eukaryotic-like serine/threonine-protein kinase